MPRMLAILTVLVAGLTACAAPKSQDVYFGTYTGKESKGIYVARLDMKTGELSDLRLAGEVKSPSFLAVHPDGKHLYCVAEISDFEGKKTGGVAAFAIKPDGTLTMLNEQESQGAGPCHISIDSKGRHAFVANYGAGSVAALPIGKDGKLGKATAAVQHTGSSADPSRQQGPHAHAIVPDPSDRYVVSADLGLDKVLVYQYDSAKGTLTPGASPFGSVAPGAGPRHFAFRPDGKFAYVINEMACTTTAFKYDAAKGELTEIQTLSSLPEPVKGNSTAELIMHPSGGFLYGSNRGHDSIVIYSIDSTTGKLTLVGHESTQGKTPRGFGIDPTGQYLIAGNQSSSTVVVFRIDAKTGKLTPVGAPVAVPTPVCVVFNAR